MQEVEEEGPMEEQTMDEDVVEIMDEELPVASRTISLRLAKAIASTVK
jgi:hypothetical protein